MCVSNRKSKKQVTSRHGNILPEHWLSMSKKCAATSLRSLGKRTAIAGRCHKEKTNFIYNLDDDHEFDDIIKSARRKPEPRTESTMPCKRYSLKEVSNTKKSDFERGRKPRAGESVGIQKNGFNAMSSVAQLTITKKQQLRRNDLALSCRCCGHHTNMPANAGVNFERRHGCVERTTAGCEPSQREWTGEDGGVWMAVVTIFKWRRIVHDV